MSNQLSLFTPNSARRPGIFCIAFLAYAGSSSLKGFADFHIQRWQVRVHGCPVHATDSGKRWIGLPSKALIHNGQLVRDEDGGKIVYAPTISFDNFTIRNRFVEGCLRALDDYAPGWDAPARFINPDQR